MPALIVAPLLAGPFFFGSAAVSLISVPAAASAQEGDVVRTGVLPAQAQAPDVLPEDELPQMDLGPAPGEEGGEDVVLDPGVDEATLLDRLAEADAGEAIRIERELQALWRKSGSAAMDLLFRRGREAMEQQDLQAAIEHFTALTDHAPDFAEGWHARATAYFHADLYGPAVADLERALALNPNNYRAIFGLGTILETFGDEKRAYEAYLRAKAIHPHFEDVTDALDRLRTGVEGQTL